MNSKHIFIQFIVVWIGKDKSNRGHCVMLSSHTDTYVQNTQMHTINHRMESAVRYKNKMTVRH